MLLICRLIRTLSVLLFVILGTVTAFSEPGDWTQVSYPVEAQELSAQPVDLTNTARAPPFTVAILASTGTALAQNGNLRVLGGMVTP